jgi:hypothetical protein
MIVVSPNDPKPERYSFQRANFNPRKMLRIKGARHGHATILAQGRKLCVEANEARRRNAAARREAKLKDQQGKAWRSSTSEITGI